MTTVRLRPPRGLFLAGLWAAALAGCGSNGSDNGQPDTFVDPPYTRQAILEACVRMHSCGVERLTRVADCLTHYEDVLRMAGMTELYKSIHRCVNRAGGDCTKVRSCFGSTPSDPPCDSTYAAGCEGTVRRYCDLADKRIYRVDCAAGRLSCVTDDKGAPFCGAGKCTTSSEVKCDAHRKLTCIGTGLQIEQCDEIQLTCGLNRDKLYDCIGTGKLCSG